MKSRSSPCTFSGLGEERLAQFFAPLKRYDFHLRIACGKPLEFAADDSLCFEFTATMPTVPNSVSVDQPLDKADRLLDYALGLGRILVGLVGAVDLHQIDRKTNPASPSGR